VVLRVVIIVGAGLALDSQLLINLDMPFDVLRLLGFEYSQQSIFDNSCSKLIAGYDFIHILISSTVGSHVLPFFNII